MHSLLVTVGSTQFPALTNHIAHPATLSALVKLGITHITVQHGTHPLPGTSLPETPLPDGLTIHPIPYTTQFSRLLLEADLVVSHAGSGTILEAVDSNKPLVVVVNSTLMDNHQTELAQAMSRCGCCHVLLDSQLTRLVSVIESALHRSSPRNPPRRQLSIFGSLVAQELANAHTNPVIDLSL